MGGGRSVYKEGATPKMVEGPFEQGNDNKTTITAVSLHNPPVQGLSC